MANGIGRLPGVLRDANGDATTVLLPPHVDAKPVLLLIADLLTADAAEDDEFVLLPLIVNAELTLQPIVRPFDAVGVFVELKLGDVGMLVEFSELPPGISLDLPGLVAAELTPYDVVRALELLVFVLPLLTDIPMLDGVAVTLTVAIELPIPMLDSDCVPEPLTLDPTEGPVLTFFSLVFELVSVRPTLCFDADSELSESVTMVDAALERAMLDPDDELAALTLTIRLALPSVDLGLRIFFRFKGVCTSPSPTTATRFALGTRLLGGVFLLEVRRFFFCCSIKMFSCRCSTMLKHFRRCCGRRLSSFGPPSMSGTFTVSGIVKSLYCS